MSPASAPSRIRRALPATALVIAGLVGAACSSDDDDAASTTTVVDDADDDAAADDAAGSSSTTEASNDTATGEVPASGEGSTTSWDPTAAHEENSALATVAPMMLIQFGQAWADADWDTMAAVADEGAVSAATDAHVADAAAPIDGENADTVIESCEAEEGTDGEAESWSCLVSYGPDGGETPFTLTLADTKSGLRITALAPADAG